ncbi:Urea active transporter [Fulvia fulva]|uniref:Urea active transporter n=1 Tax=Passalora fulva TaxID=5499 RepID=A0A9Q8US98_PASFU|nr:Urea active transporter [Fulvia fulva]KAK4618590.1 Urea active transporter [Fulvia fulva]UJO20619.1 Urea active transporter [Fulvia fulva]
MDTAFWQMSFAAEVHATVPGYDLASIAIIAIPWCTGTIIGLSARAIEKTPIWLTYPSTLTPTQINQGLVMPFVLASLLGKPATAALLVLIFMAITSTVSSSMIAVSSIISLDFYRTYFNPLASDRKTLQISHLGVVFHGCFMAGFAVMLQYAGAANNWATYVRPIVACPGIFPMMLTIVWERQTRLAAILAPLLGLCSGLGVWLSLSWRYGGAIDIDTTQLQLPGLYGATTSFFSPLVYSVVISLAKPSRFDWREFLRMELIEDKTPTVSSRPSTIAVSLSDDFQNEEKPAFVEGKGPESVSSQQPPAKNKAQADLDDVVHPFGEETIKHIKHWLKIAVTFLLVNILVTIVLWPMPFYRDWVFTKSFFGGWVTMALIWQWLAFFTVVVYPVYDGRHAIVQALKGLSRDLAGRK